uniref:Uncharacterized protein n=1 Tax=Plectus sambesii TaxID=2011161 RepID=A0A914X707_9BILA
MLVTLIPSSALLLLLETRHTARVGSCHSSRQLHSLSDYISATRDMFIMDVVGLVAIGPLRRALNCALLVGLILFGLHIYQRQSHKEADPKPDDLLRFAHEDMFVNRRDPFQAIGRLGRLDYLCIVALAACDVMQARDCMMVDLLTIVRAIATLSLLFTPAFFGGAVQSVKTAGRTAIALRASIQRFVKFL